MAKNKHISELKELVLAGAVVFFIVSLVLMDLWASLRLFMAYMLCIYLPFVLPVATLKLPLVESFLLVNLAGLSYAAIYVIFDLVLNIPLTKPVFAVTTLLAYALGYFYYRKTSE